MDERMTTVVEFAIAIAVALYTARFLMREASPPPARPAPPEPAREPPLGAHAEARIATIATLPPIDRPVEDAPTQAFDVAQLFHEPIAPPPPLPLPGIATTAATASTAAEAPTATIIAIESEAAVFDSPRLRPDPDRLIQHEVVVRAGRRATVLAAMRLALAVVTFGLLLGAAILGAVRAGEVLLGGP